MPSAEQLLAGLPPRISHLLWQWEDRAPDAPASRDWGWGRATG